MKARPKNWKPKQISILVADTVNGKVVDTEADLPLLADGSIYHEMLDRKFDDLKHALWAQMEREKGNE